MNGSPFNIQGVTLSGTVPPTAPLLLVVGGPKSGKSSTTISLYGYPGPDDQPLVISIDAGGVDSCSKFGFQVAHIKVKDMPGIDTAAKLNATLDAIERGMTSGKRPGSLVVDCMSTLAERLVAEESRVSKNPDPRSHYFKPLNVIRDFMNRLIDLGLPTVMLAWLEEGGVREEKTPSGQKVRRQYLGGPSIMGGKAKAQIAGKADMILVLDKHKIGLGQPGADQDGYIRQFHTRTWDSIEAGGRYTLPEPCPANLGWALAVITGKIPNPALQPQ